MLPVLFDVQRVLADEVFGAVLDACDGQERRAAGAGSGMNLADAVDAFIGFDLDVVEAVCGEDFDCCDFHFFTVHGRLMSGLETGRDCLPEILRRYEATGHRKQESQC